MFALIFVVLSYMLLTGLIALLRLLALPFTLARKRNRRASVQRAFASLDAELARYPYTKP